MKTHRLLLPALLLALILFQTRQPARAGSATWNLNPTTGNWNTAANWTPNTVPNGSNDNATFGLSNRTDVSISEDTSILGMIFDADASAYHFTIPPSRHFTIDEGNLQNNSDVVQTFDVLAADTAHDYTSVAFGIHSKAGSNTLFIAHGASLGAGANPGFTQFSAPAGSATLVNNGGLVSGAKGGEVDFFSGGNAGSATITNKAGTVTGALGGRTLFWYGSATNSVITAECASISGAEGGVTIFMGGTDAGNATVIAEGGSNGGGGGSIQFQGASFGGIARFEVFGNGDLDITSRTAPGMTIGSLEGDGQVLVGANALTIGSNNLSTTFSGSLQGSSGGALVKIGTGTLTLSGLNSYTGGTTVGAGTLLVTTKQVSGTGSGPVQVNGGTLGGTSPLAGAVTIGSGSGPGAFFSPGVNGTAAITCKSALTFNADGAYNCEVNSSQSKSDQVIANKGVTIQSGALFSFLALGHGTLPVGTTFTVIKKNGHSPITGTFSNLPDGAIVSVNGNNFQASYEGGDGNDLTLTVVP